MSVDFLALTAISLAALNWLFFQILTILRGHEPKCPRCWGRRTRSALRRAQDFIFPAFISPRRCERCQRRFYALTSINYQRRLRPATRASRRPELAHS
jgi:hypothetical protein